MAYVMPLPLSGAYPPAPASNDGRSPAMPAVQTIAMVFARLTIPFILVPMFAVACLEAPVGAAQENKSDALTRTCGHSDDETLLFSRSKHKKRGGSAPEKIPYVPACLEVRALPLEVQEHLQQFVRQQRWAIFDEEVNETLWSFSLPLTREELLVDANPPPGTSRVTWERGRTVVLVRTIALNDGYSRTTVSAQFRGYGESDDTFAVQRSFWEWSSSGKLEARFTEELRARFGAAANRANP